MSRRVAVAMSGGVDSSVAAAMLVEQGYDVVGLTMCFNIAEAPGKKPRCCGYQGIQDARRVAATLGIPHYVLHMQQALEKYVIDDFCRQYLQGRTPNPCIRCNQHIKFSALLKKANALGFDYLATGHYVRIKEASRARLAPLMLPKKGKNFFLLGKAKDTHKDQSYFIYRLEQEQLSKILFPLGGLVKQQVREYARRMKLPVADKAESQEICFIPDKGLQEFVRARASALGYTIQPGPVKDQSGRLLGEHKGIAFYTIGQRGGLGIAAGQPVYVKEIQSDTNTVIVGSKESVMQSECRIKNCVWAVAPLKKRIALKVKIRYNHPEAAAWVEPCSDELKVRFKQPQYAITPGQSAVLYYKNMVLGGGIIESAG